MTKPKKVYLQCGWEDECETKDCLNCPRKHKITIEISHAEFTVTDEFSICDLPMYAKEKPEVFDLAQKVMFDLQKKIWESIKDNVEEM